MDSQIILKAYPSFKHHVNFMQNGSKLGPEKAINFPRSKLHFEGLTVKDLMDLDFIAANADLVGVSFVNDFNDVSILQ